MPKIRAEKLPATVKPPHRVVAIAYEGLCTFEFGCAVEIFGQERPELGVQWYRFDVCSIERKPIQALGGIYVRTKHGIDLLDQADTIVIPGWRDVTELPPARLLQKIRAAYARGARLCTLCSGVFVLAAAGVLDGRSATTHWRYGQRLADAYPKLTVELDALYVDGGQVITAAGSAAGLDMLMHIVRQDYGAQVANRVAQRLVLPPHRAGGQAQFLPRPMPLDDGGGLAKLMAWVRTNLSKPQSLSTLAKQAGMSTRTLQRHFMDAAGMSPGEWLIRERVAAAKELLELGNDRIADIAGLVGFGSEESMRRHFRLQTGVTPNAYRQQFDRTRDTPSRIF
jgi:AraC family transcriptional regulator, transcriptional activator FtrA